MIVFDADIYEHEPPERFSEILDLCEPDNILAMTNPSFKLFLLLHVEDAYHRFILPNQQQLL